MQCRAEDCWVEFTSSIQHQVFCSPQCRNRHKSRNQECRRSVRRKIRTDRVCSAEDCATTIPSAAHALRLYCSDRCRDRQSGRNFDRRGRYRAFGATLGDYDRLLMEQRGHCAICGTEKPGREGLMRFAFDHDHVTNQPRGLLCYLCNVGLGSFQDDPVLLRAATAYLERHSSSSGANPPVVERASSALAP